MADLAIHVTPKADRDAIGGWRGSELSVRVSAAPEDGKANAATCRLIAKSLGVPKSAVRVVRGQTSRHKIVRVEGVEPSELSALVGDPPEQLF